MLGVRFVAVALAVLCILPICTVRWAMAADPQPISCRRWGRPSILVDIGGGTTTALVRSGVEATQLDALLISHVHPDHVSDLPEFLWGEMVANRRRDFVIAGPAGANAFHSLDAFLKKQFGPGGAFPDMQALLNDDEFPLESIAIKTEKHRISRVFERNGLQVSAYPVPHGRARVGVSHRRSGLRCRVRR